MLSTCDTATLRERLTVRPGVNLTKSLLEGAGASLFGLLAGVLLPVVLRRLRAYGVIS